MSEVEFIRRLDQALMTGDSHPIDEVKRRELLASASRDVGELRVQLENKARTLESTLRDELRGAGETEATRTLALLAGLKKRIEQELEKRARDEQRARARAAELRARAGPALFDTGRDDASPEDERVRREKAYEKRAMAKRQVEIDREILEEPDRIRRRYEVRTVRLEPAGIVYLWPTMG
jgi:hypothetical protein